MIRDLHIENFRCLRDIKLRLEPLTVLVGANASGKSSVFGALRGNYVEHDRWKKDRKSAVRVSVTMDSGLWAMHLQPGHSFSQQGAAARVQTLRLDLAQLRQHDTLAEAQLHSPAGTGLANVFATLTRKARDQVAQEFCALVPMFVDVDARPSSQGKHRIIFQDRWNQVVWYEPEQVSDGSMLLLAYLLLPHQSPAPDVIAIEEPERGLHPYLMGRLVDVLRKLSRGELGPKKVQVLLATHSAELLEHVEPKEVRFLNRSKDTGETIVEEAPVDSPTWRIAFHEYDDSIGRLWLSGGLGGVPSCP